MIIKKQQLSLFSMSIRESIQGQLNGKEPIQMQLFPLSSDTEIMHELGNNTSMVGDFPKKFSITTKS